MSTPLSSVTVGKTAYTLPNITPESQTRYVIVHLSPIDSLSSACPSAQDMPTRAANKLAEVVKHVLALPGKILSLFWPRTQAPQTTPSAPATTDLIKSTQDSGPLRPTQPVLSQVQEQAKRMTMIEHQKLLREEFFPQKTRPADAKELSQEEYLIAYTLTRMLDATNTNETEEEVLVRAIRDFKRATGLTPRAKKIPDCVYTALEKHPENLENAFRHLLREPVINGLLRAWGLIVIHHAAKTK